MVAIQNAKRRLHVTLTSLPSRINLSLVWLCTARPANHATNPKSAASTAFDPLKCEIESVHFLTMPVSVVRIAQVTRRPAEGGGLEPPSPFGRRFSRPRETLPINHLSP
jgi:hypothetical protein